MMNGIRNEVMVVVETPFVDGRMIFLPLFLPRAAWLRIRFLAASL